MESVNPKFSLSCSKTVCSRTYKKKSSLFETSTETVTLVMVPYENIIFFLHTIVAVFQCVSSPGVLAIYFLESK